MIGLHCHLRLPQMCVSFLFFDQVTKLFDKKHVLLKLALCLAQYTEESVQERIRPQPDLGKFISASELAALAKESDLCDLVQQTMAENRRQLFPALSDAASAGSAKAGWWGIWGMEETYATVSGRLLEIFVLSWSCVSGLHRSLPPHTPANRGI